MASFDRSASGRNNRALFYGVDRILYVEGGRDDKGAVESFDGLFWRRVFYVLRPELKLKILPRGSKDNVLQLAQQSVGDTIVICAIDRDYDGILDRLVNRDSVLYTFGYSYENDIFDRQHLHQLFYNICPLCDHDLDIEQTVSELVDEFCSAVWWAQLADICGNLVARKVIDRRRVSKYLSDGNYGARPKISKPFLASDVYKANSGNPRDRVNNVPLRRDHLPRLSVGHLYAQFCFKTICYLHHKYSATQKLTRDAVTAGAIGVFVQQLISSPSSEIAVYYRERLSRC